MKKKDNVTVICYGKSEVWESRQEALNYYYEGMLACDGSEKERYTKIWTEIRVGKEVCSDV